jgi:hypothetical protein
MENSQAKAKIAALDHIIDNLYKFYSELIDLDKEQRFSFDCYNEVTARIEHKITHYKMLIRDIQREFNL